MATIQNVWQRIAVATRVLNTEIKKEIIKQNAVDTGRMKNVTRIVKIRWDESKDDIDLYVSSTFYYHGEYPGGGKWKEKKGVDVGRSKKYKSGKVNRNITEAFLKREKVKDQLNKVIGMIFEYRIDQQFK